MNAHNPLDLAAIAVAQRANQRAADALSLLRIPSTPDGRWRQLLRRFSLTAAIADLCHEQRRGAALEVHQEMIARGQQPAQPNSIVVPYEAMSTRALMAATPAGGGDLVQDLNLAAADALRARMVCGALGATIIPAPARANVSLPQMTGTATAYWLTDETDQITEQDETFAQIAFTPHTVGAYTEVSRLLLLQAAPSSADDIIKRDLSALVARAIGKRSINRRASLRPQPL